MKVSHFRLRENKCHKSFHMLQSRFVKSLDIRRSLSDYTCSFWYRNDPNFFGQIGLGKQCRRRSDCDQGLHCFNSICIFWMHSSIVKPPCSNFRVIKTNFLRVRILGLLWNLKLNVTAFLPPSMQHWACSCEKGTYQILLDRRNVKNVKAQKSLCIHAVLPEPSLFKHNMSHPTTKPTKWRVPCKDSDQPGHLPSLISLHCALNR